MKNIKTHNEIMPDADWGLIPDYMKDGVARYVEYGIMPGGFLTAVLENNLFMAIGKADDCNKQLLANWCMFVWNELPATCWGDKETVKAWAKSRMDAFEGKE